MAAFRRKGTIGRIEAALGGVEIGGVGARVFRARQ